MEPNKPAFEPYISAKDFIPEFTPKAILLGVFWYHFWRGYRVPWSEGRAYGERVDPYCRFGHLRI